MRDGTRWTLDNPTIPYWWIDAQLYWMRQIAFRPLLMPLAIDNVYVLYVYGSQVPGKVGSKTINPSRLSI